MRRSTFCSGSELELTSGPNFRREKVSARRSILFWLVLSVLVLPQRLLEAQKHFDVIIRNGRVLDGSGNPWFRADVALRGNRIVALGKLDGAPGEHEIDATGLYVTPGFIDSHSHAAGGLASSEGSAAEQWLTQGVTTAIINPNGGGPVNLPQQRQMLLRDGLGINVAQMVPHGSVRREVIGLVDRLATKSELEQMRSLVRRGMETGAYGLSSGPFYVPGSYSDTRELVELAKVVAAYDGVYTSHIRDESNYTIGLVAAVDEVIQIAREAELPGVVTHIKALGPPVWGYSLAVVQRIEKAREEGLEVYADQYPYPASSTSLAAGLLPRWAQSGGRDSLLARFGQPETMAKIRAAMVGNLARRGGADRIQFRQFEPVPSVQGRTLAQVATSGKSSRSRPH